MISWLTISSVFSSVVWGQTKAPVARKEGTALVEGIVVDAATKQPVIGAIITANSQSGTMRSQQVVTTNGTYQLTLDPKQPYAITIRANGYEPHDEQLTFTSPKVEWLKKQPTGLYRLGTKPASTTTTAPPTTASTTTTTPSPTVSGAVASAARPSAGISQPAAGPRVTPPKTLDAKVVYTPPLVVAPTGKTTQLRAIQFVQSKAELLPDAQPALEQLLAFLTSNPTAEIELSGHTDNQGDFDENIRLSKQRVDLVKDLLVKSGIAPSRIVTRGYGPTRPIASNNSEATRQLNRRVEMIVVKQ